MSSQLFSQLFYIYMERSSASTFSDRTGRCGQWPGRCYPVRDAEALSTAQLAQRSRTIRSGSRNLWRGQQLASPLILVLFIKYGAAVPLRRLGALHIYFLASSDALTPAPSHENVPTTRSRTRTHTPGKLRADIPTGSSRRSSSSS